MPRGGSPKLGWKGLAHGCCSQRLWNQCRPGHGIGLFAAEPDMSLHRTFLLSARRNRPDRETNRKPCQIAPSIGDPRSSNRTSRRPCSTSPNVPRPGRCRPGSTSRSQVCGTVPAFLLTRSCVLPLETANDAVVSPCVTATLLIRSRCPGSLSPLTLARSRPSGGCRTRLKPSAARESESPCHRCRGPARVRPVHRATVTVGGASRHRPRLQAYRCKSRQLTRSQCCATCVSRSPHCDIVFDS